MITRYTTEGKSFQSAFEIFSLVESREGHKALQGQVANRELHTIHSCSEVVGSEEIIDGVFLGADLRHASKLVEQKRAKASQFKFFYSATQWQPGQLQREFKEVCYSDICSSILNL